MNRIKKQKMSYWSLNGFTTHEGNSAIEEQPANRVNNFLLILLPSLIMLITLY